MLTGISVTHRRLLARGHVVRLVRDMDGRLQVVVRWSHGVTSRELLDAVAIARAGR